MRFRSRPAVAAPDAPAWRSQSGTSLPEVHGSILIPHDAPPWRKILAFAGPGFLVAVGYMDPGNWATDLAGGAQFGYSLLWVIMMSNLMAILLQHLCIKLGVVTGRDLAQACRDHYPRPIVVVPVGPVRAGHRRHRPRRGRRLGDRPAAALRHPARSGAASSPASTCWWSSTCRTAASATSRRSSSRWWRRSALCFVAELLFSKPELARRARRLHPVRAACFTNQAQLYVAIGILGATVMPHNLYLHSSIVQTRKYRADEPTACARRCATRPSTRPSR